MGLNLQRSRKECLKGWNWRGAGFCRPAACLRDLGRIGSTFFGSGMSRMLIETTNVDP
jgi:hypothetical protein